MIEKDGERQDSERRNEPTDSRSVMAVLNGHNQSEKETGKKRQKPKSETEEVEKEIPESTKTEENEADEVLPLEAQAGSRESKEHPPGLPATPEEVDELEKNQESTENPGTDLDATKPGKAAKIEEIRNRQAA